MSYSLARCVLFRHAGKGASTWQGILVLYKVHFLAIMRLAPKLTLFLYCTDTCRGFGDAASEKTCKTSKSKTACLKTMTLKTQNLTASCVWQDDQSSALVETQKLTSNGIPLGIKGLNYQKNICGVRVKVDLPKEAKSRWGVNVRLWGGPGNVNDWHPTTNPDIPITTSGCTASKGAPLSCSATLVAPTGYTLDPNFVENTATLDFFTSV